MKRFEQEGKEHASKEKYYKTRATEVRTDMQHNTFKVNGIKFRIKKLMPDCQEELKGSKK